MNMKQTRFAVDFRAAGWQKGLDERDNTIVRGEAEAKGSVGKNGRRVDLAGALAAFQTFSHFSPRRLKRVAAAAAAAALLLPGRRARPPQRRGESGRAHGGDHNKCG